ncbi:MAG: AAA family ATPase [Chitinivibrionales bacterium]|nr:AAA family ATPase [Chitinivibrionales bacterium]
MDLFEHSGKGFIEKNAPLADRMRPRTLDEFVGQEHIIGPGRLLRRAITIDQISSVLFYGPPGTGKTTLARIIANTTKAQFISINAVLAGVKDIRAAIETAHKSLSLYSKRTILFVDEVHRFNKSQQDALLPHVENGVIIIIGATTENPYFEVNKALVSRSRIFRLRSLTAGDLRTVARMALKDPERGYGRKNVRIDNGALDHLVTVANGDARGVLNALELAVETTEPDTEGTVNITRDVAEESIQRKAVLYDKDGDAHYDTISAFIKSIRGSDPDAALYWMSRMVYAGEDPRFIFRRMLILASEDIGLADPDALGVVVNAARAFEYVGIPEGRFHLAQACLYLATAAKSNSTLAFFDALKSVAEETAGDVPDHLKDASRDGEDFGHGKGYLYPHAYRDHWVAQQYLPDVLQNKMFYQPSGQGREKEIKVRVDRLREARVEAMVEQEDPDPFTPHAGDNSKHAGNAWIKRTSSETGLAEIRDRVLELAEISRDSLVLDFHARTGLIAFEAQRRIREGGVWALAHTDSEYSTLVTMAGRFPALGRPFILKTTRDTFTSDIKQAGGDTIAFTSIVGRRILAKQQDKAGLLCSIASLLAPGGVLALAETIPRLGQRLSDIVTFSRKESSLKKKFADAENELFDDTTDPMVNWTMESLEKEFPYRAEYAMHTFTETIQRPKRITHGEIEFWFRESSNQERRSLGDQLRGMLSEKEFMRCKEIVTGCCVNRDITWKTAVGYIKLAKKSSRKSTGETGTDIT